MRLIDADALTDAVEGITWYHINSQGKMVSGARSDMEAWYKAQDIYNAIESAPTIDAVKVVRCKECKYCFNGQCWKFDGLDKFDSKVAANDFCSRADRKTEPFGKDINVRSKTEPQERSE